MLVAIASLGLLLGLGAGEALGAVTWSGAWTRDEHPGETLAISQAGSATARGSTATGSYTWSGTGTIRGDVWVVTSQRLRMTGSWNDKGGTGRFRIAMSFDLKSYTGTWGWGTNEAGGGTFTGSCIGGACASNAPRLGIGARGIIADAGSFRRLWTYAERRKNSILKSLSRNFRVARDPVRGRLARAKALRRMKRNIVGFRKLERLLEAHVKAARVEGPMALCLKPARSHNYYMSRRHSRLQKLYEVTRARNSRAIGVWFRKQSKDARRMQAHSKRVLACIKSAS